MKTKHINGLLDVHFLKPEGSLIERAHELVAELAIMQPIRKELSAAAKVATEALGTILSLAVHDAPAYSPLFDQAEKKENSGVNSQKSSG